MNETMKILILNGPNLNLQGRRDTGVYGSQTFESYFEALKANYPSVEFGYFQSNIEGELIDAVQQADGMVISPRILGGVTGLSPAAVLIAIFVGSHVCGILGMLLALPVLMTFRTAYRIFVQRHENV